MYIYVSVYICTYALLPAGFFMSPGCEFGRDVDSAKICSSPNWGSTKEQEVTWADMGKYGLVVIQIGMFIQALTGGTPTR